MKQVQRPGQFQQNNVMYPSLPSFDSQPTGGGGGMFQQQQQQQQHFRPPSSPYGAPPPRSFGGQMPSQFQPRNQPGQFGGFGQQQKPSFSNSPLSPYPQMNQKPPQFGGMPQPQQRMPGSMSQPQQKGMMGKSQQMQMPQQPQQQEHPKPQEMAMPTWDKTGGTAMGLSAQEDSSASLEEDTGMSDMVQQSGLTSTTGQTSNTEVVKVRDKAMDYFKPYQAGANQYKFEVKSSRVLSAALQKKEYMWCQAGSMIAYTGKVSFSKKDLFDDMKNIVRSAGEKLFKNRLDLMRCTAKNGPAQVMLSGDGKKIVPFFLKKGESVVIQKEHILAFESSVKYKIHLLKNLSSWLQGGLLAIKLSGPGFVAIVCDFDPIVFEMMPGLSVKTDYKNTIFWSGNLSPKFKTDIKLKAVIGWKSSEEFQMHWQGDTGFVGVSPKERKKKKRTEKKVEEVIQAPVNVMPEQK